MRDYLTPLLQFQRFFLPLLLALVFWAVWRTVIKKDLAVGLALYLGLVVIVDGFYNTGIYLPGLEKGSIRYSELCAAFLLIFRPAPVPRRAPYRSVCFLFGLYFVLMFVSVLRSDPLLPAVFEFRRVIFPQILAFLVALRLLDRPEAYRRFFLCLIVLVLVVGVFDFWDIFFDRWLLHSDVLSDPMYWNNRRQGRFGSIFLNPNYLGAFVVLLFPPLFAHSFGNQRVAVRMFFWLGLLSLAFCLIETQSRGPLLAFAIVLSLLAVGPLGHVSRMRRFAMFALFAVVLVLFMPGFYEHSIKRFSTIEAESSQEVVSRESTWEYTLRLIEDRPILGIGFGEGEFRSAMAATNFADRYGRESLDNPHNSYLQAAVYAGIPALAIFLLANLILLAHAIRVSMSAKKGATLPAVFGIAVGMVGFLLSIYPDMHLFTWTVAPVYWVFAGLLLALVSKDNSGHTEGRIAESPDEQPSRLQLSGG